MTEAERITNRIQNGFPNIKRGTLRFWGSWFGRPYDNHHEIVDSDAAEDLLRVRFNAGEVLSVWNPRRAAIDDQVFRIEEASRVRWEWFRYGRPQNPENLYYQEFVDNGSEVIATTNVDWHDADLKPDRSSAAVEIL